MKKLSLQKLSQNELEKREMNQLLGGGKPGFCGCGCNGSSSTDMNGRFNSVYGYTESTGGVTACGCGNSTVTDSVLDYFKNR